MTPAESGGESEDCRQLGIVAQLVAAVQAFGLPLILLFATAMVWDYLDERVGWYERILSLTFGLPSTMLASILSIKLWKRGFRLVPISGLVAWIAFNSYMVFLTIVFWDG